MSKPSIAKNYLYQIVYQIMQIIIPLITAPYLMRVLGAEGNGIYSYVYSIADYFVAFGALGIATYGNRLIAQSRDNRHALNNAFSSLLCAHVLVSGIVLVVYLVFFAFFGGAYSTYYAIMIPLIISGIFDISWFFYGLEEFKIAVTRNIAIKVLSAILIFMFVRTEADLWKYLAITSLSTLVGTAVLWFHINRYVRFVKPSISETLKHIRPLCVLFVSTLAVSLYTKMDKIMVGQLSDMTQVGYYEGAYKIYAILNGIAAAFGTVMLPRMSNIVANHDENAINRQMKYSFKYIMCVSVAISFGMYAVSTTLIPIYYGDAYVDSIHVLKILSISSIFCNMAHIIRTHFLLPHSMDKEQVACVVVAAIGNVLVNAALIPFLGASGAAIGTVFAELTALIVQIVLVKKYIKISKNLLPTIVYSLFGFVMVLVVKFIEQLMGITVLSLAVETLVGAIVYLLLCLIYLIITKDPLILRCINRIKNKIA